MKTTYKKPITDIAVLRLQGSVLDNNLPTGNYSRDIDNGDANIMADFEAEEEDLLPTRGSLWDD
ncbi:MAG: hypothetical protein IKQ77_01860 [Prevotella sp.]|nr:hypothetical protein [Prevotella sp.]